MGTIGRKMSGRLDVPQVCFHAKSASAEIQCGPRRSSRCSPALPAWPRGLVPVRLDSRNCRCRPQRNPSSRVPASWSVIEQAGVSDHRLDFAAAISFNDARSVPQEAQHFSRAADRRSGCARPIQLDTLAPCRRWAAGSVSVQGVRTWEEA
jgi:hypothetical protein